MFTARHSLSLMLAAVSCSEATTQDQAKNRPPNIVLIYADDLGWKDVGYQGTDFYETPNIDRLAGEGMVFTAGYAAAANCQPSRACLLSGQYTPRHHVFAVQSTNRGPKHRMRMVPIPNRSGIAGETTMADVLKSDGYATGIFGKWHLDRGAQGAPPSDHGFDVVADRKGRGKKISDNPKSIYSLTRAACAFMEKNKSRPFFVYMAHHAIHTGLQSRPATKEKFDTKERGQQHRNKNYAACTFDLDDGVGILLTKLADLGLANNTMVVFTSDNGATRQSSQEPLRGNKGSYHEGGIREPFIVRWPGVVEPGSKCDVPVIQIDLFPTFLAAAGAEVPKGKVLDGESLLPLLRQTGGLRRKSIFWHFPGYLNTAVTRGRDPLFRTRPVSVINRGHLKLYLYHEEWQLDGGRAKVDTNNSVELYDLRSDVGERRNLAAENKQQRDTLLEELLAWMDRVKAPLPTEKNGAYDPNKLVEKRRRRRRKE